MYGDLEENDVVSSSLEVVCRLSSTPICAHMLVKTHKVLYVLPTSTEVTKFVVGKMGSQWISPSLWKLSALRREVSLEIYHRGDSECQLDSRSYLPRY
jgi:hypothetical protein